MNYVPGGMENYLSNLIHRLKDNHEIVLMIPDNFKKSIVGVKYYQFAERGPFKYISLLKEAIRLCVIEKPKVISAFMPSIASGFLFTVGKIFRIKTAINLRGFEMYNAMNRFIIASSFLVTQYIITNGQNLVRKYAENAGLLSQIILSKPSFFIPNAIDSAKWEYNRQEKKEFDLVYIANINSSIRIEQKGFVYLYEAIEKIHKTTGKRLKTVIIGSYNFNDIKNALPNFNSDSFVFLGLISNKGKIKEYLAKSCIFVLPSTEEGMPNALMEAMAFGIPSIATDVGSVNLLIPSNEMGLIIPPKNTDALVNSILSLIHEEPRRSELSRNAKKFIQNNFSWNPQDRKSVV